MKDMKLMSKDRHIANIIDGLVVPIIPKLLPLFLARTGDIEGWLASRAVDSHRPNSRLLKKALRLQSKADIPTVLSVNAATITDTYWVKPIEDDQTNYEDVRFKSNAFDLLALNGDPDQFNLPPSRTPEVTNIGSFEKCWKKSQIGWQLIKSGTDKQLFSEQLAYFIGSQLQLNVATYVPVSNRKYISSTDFTNSGSVNFEPIVGIIGEETDYVKIYDMLKQYGQDISDAFVKQCYFDALIRNVDRHEYNYGVLRDPDTGRVLGMAPMFDHNLSLVAAEKYPQNIKSVNDRLINDYIELVSHIGQLPAIEQISRSVLKACIDDVVWELPPDDAWQEPKSQLLDYILCRQEAIASPRVIANNRTDKDVLPGSESVTPTRA